MTPKTGHAPVSLIPDSFTAGGMLDDQDVAVLTARFEEFDYQGHADEPVCALAVSMKPVGDDDAEERTQYYSAGGNLSRFTPSADRKSMVPAKEGIALNKNSNLALFLSNLVNAGFPADRLAKGDVSVLDGSVLHVNQIAAPKRAGGDAKFAQKEGKTILLPTKVVSLPEEAKGKKTSAAASAKATNGSGKPMAQAAPAGDASEDPTDQAVGIVLGILATQPKLTKTALSQAAFKAGARGAAMSLIAKTEFLADSERPWTFKDGTVSAGE